MSGSEPKGRRGTSRRIGYAFGPFLAEHPEFAGQAPYLKDLVSQPWSLFESKERP